MKNKEENPILNQVLTPDFLKELKGSVELNSFMKNLYARAWSTYIDSQIIINQE